MVYKNCRELWVCSTALLPTVHENEGDQLSATKCKACVQMCRVNGLVVVTLGEMRRETQEQKPCQTQAHGSKDSPNSDAVLQGEGHEQSGSEAERTGKRVGRQQGADVVRAERSLQTVHGGTGMV